MPYRFQPEAPRLVSAAEPPAQLPAGAVAALPAGPPASTPPPAPAAPGRRKRSARFELRAAVLAALDQLGDTFDRDDLLQSAAQPASRGWAS